MLLRYTVIALLCHEVYCLSSSAINGTLRDVPEDGVLDFVQLAAKYGHKPVAHEVVTEDNYISTLFNLKGNKKKPVLMVHGILDTSDGWIMRGNISLGIQLANEGYDVWLLNVRGNRYARKHKTLNPDTDIKFWDYCSHELGTYDLPANIDYVLNATGQKKLSLVAFSQGTTMSYVMGATRPEYNDKVKLLVSLAPIAFLQNTIGPLHFVIQVAPFLDLIIPGFINEIAGYYSLTKALVNLLCTQLVIGYDLCFGGAVNPFIGPHAEAIDNYNFKIMMGHFPAGTSKKNLMHYSQIALRRAFADYDYGVVKNIQVYGSVTPPTYDLNKVTMPVAMFSGKNDYISTLDDVKILHGLLPNVILWKELANPLYNHLDLLWAADVHTVVNPHVLEIVAKYHLNDGKSSDTINEIEYDLV